MYRIGYLDDEYTQFDYYCRKIKRFDNELDLIKIPGSNDIQMILRSITDEKFDVVLIDYKMAKALGFNGTAIANIINDYICDIKCFILTQVDRSEIQGSLVANRDIISKKVFDTEGDDSERIKELQETLLMLKESAIVFRSRCEEKVREYIKLLEEKEHGNSIDEFKFERLYETLSSYGYVEKLPREMLTDNYQKNLEKLIEIGNRILNKEEN